jgi:hypothetical protein
LENIVTIVVDGKQYSCPAEVWNLIVKALSLYTDLQALNPESKPDAQAKPEGYMA